MRALEPPGQMPEQNERGAERARASELTLAFFRPRRFVFAASDVSSPAGIMAGDADGVGTGIQFRRFSIVSKYRCTEQIHTVRDHKDQSVRSCCHRLASSRL